MINLFNDTEKIQRIYETMLYEMWSEIEPILLKAYKILNKEGKNYDINKTHHENMCTMWTDSSIYVGVLKGYKYGKSMVFSNGSVNFVVLFNDKKHESNYSIVNKGVRIFRIFEDIDMDCINSWGLNENEKWITNASLVTDTFTDITKYSQNIGKEIVCKRPTIRRLLDDLNNCKFQHYYPIFCTSTKDHSRDFSMIEYSINNIIILCVRLDLSGVKF